MSYIMSKEVLSRKVLVILVINGKVKVPKCDNSSYVLGYLDSSTCWIVNIKRIFRDWVSSL